MYVKAIITNEKLTNVGLANLVGGILNGNYAIKDGELLMSCGGYNGIPLEFCSVMDVAGFDDVETMVENLNNVGCLIGKEEKELYTLLKRLFSM